MQVIEAVVVADDRIVRTGALKIATAGGLLALTTELEAINRLSGHRAIPTVYAWAATPDGTHVAAILFEKMDRTLADDVRQRFAAVAASGLDPPYPIPARPLYSPAECWTIIRALAELLTAAHALGLYHRDIKPENIMFDADGNVKLVDWGLCFCGTPADEGTCVMQGPIGTRGYSLPELSAGGAVLLHHSIDTQPFALTLVFMLMARAPTEVRVAYACDWTLAAYLPADVTLRVLIISTLQDLPERRAPMEVWMLKTPAELLVPLPLIEASGLIAVDAPSGVLPTPPTAGGPPAAPTTSPAVPSTAPALS